MGDAWADGMGGGTCRMTAAPRGTLLRQYVTRACKNKNPAEAGSCVALSYCRSGSLASADQAETREAEAEQCERAGLGHETRWR